MAKCPLANLAQSQKLRQWLTSENLACNHTNDTLLNKKPPKVPVTCGRNSVNDLASSNDVATYGVNGRIDNKTWCKCKCCTSMETNISFCCLELPEICKPRFTSALCLNLCRSHWYFVMWFSRREDFVRCLTSTQCWSLANQNKSFLSLQTSLLFSLNGTFYLITYNQIFFFIRDVF